MDVKKEKMNWFQVKMIKKGTKPLIWRRGFIPNGITFAQLAWVLEEMLDCEKSDRYEFEFYPTEEGDLDAFFGDGLYCLFSG